MVSRAFLFAPVALLARQVLASCAYGTHLLPRAVGPNGEPVVKIGTFGYTGDKGPANWVGLNATANQLCSTGRRQSPIDVRAGKTQMVSASDVVLQIPDMTEGTLFENLGTTIEVVAKPGASMTLSGTTYELQQFHFHLPSEHLDNGTSQAMEMHMVWQTQDQKVAVIGVWIDIDPESAVGLGNGQQKMKKMRKAKKNKRSIWTRGARMLRKRQEEEEEEGEVQEETTDPQEMGSSALPLAITERDSVLLETIFSQVEQIKTPGTFTTTAPLIMSELVNSLNSASYQGYSGSLTTPPCSEGVSWLVSTNKLMIQANTWLRVRDVIGFNSRFPQNYHPGENVLALGNKSVVPTPAAA